MTLPEQIADLHKRSTPELAAHYQDLFGGPPRSRNPIWLRKRIAFRLQENAYGGLSRTARAAVARLSAELRLPDAAPARRTAGDVAADVGVDVTRPAPKPLRPGTVLLRQWRGQQIRVEALPDGGFEWDGCRYGSLSAVAFAITGTKWNGRLFFGLTTRGRT